MLVESRRLKNLCRKMPMNISVFISALVSFLGIRAHIQSRTPSVQASHPKKRYNPVTVNLFSPIQSIGSHKKLSFAFILSLLSHIEIRHNAAVSCPCKQSIYSVVFLGFLNMFGSPLCSVSNSVLTDLDHYRFYRHHVIMPKQIALD